MSMSTSTLRIMPALIVKDCVAMRVPILASVIVGICCYVVPFVGQLLAEPNGVAFQPAVAYPVPQKLVVVRRATSYPTAPWLISLQGDVFHPGHPPEARFPMPLPVPLMQPPTLQTAARRFTLSTTAIINAAQVGIVVTAFLAAVFGGIAIAGERAERTAEFLAMLPVTRGQIMGSKATVGFSMIFACAIVHWGIALMLWRSGAWHESNEDLTLELFLWPACVCSLLGVAWLLSTCARSAPISACASIAVTIGTLAVLDILQSDRGRHAHVHDMWDSPLALATPLLLLGGASALLGTIHYMKRIEP
jgi:hypothetical protein